METIYAASPLHDIGKVGIPDSILLKPGSSFVRMGIEISEGHHERWDGTGYPRGRAGEEIPLSARILALGDVHDALTSRRCYKEPFSHERSRGIILKSRGCHFDPRVVEAFLATEETFIQVKDAHQDPE